MEGFARVDGMGNDFDVGADRHVRVEGVGEDPLQRAKGAFGGVDGEGLAAHFAEAAQVVEAHDMVVVAMGEDHCVKVFQAVG